MRIRGEGLFALSVSVYASSGTPLKKLSFTPTSAVAEWKRLRRTGSVASSVTCIQLAIAVRQSNMCVAPLNMSVVTPPTPLQQMVESYHDNIHKPFERLPLLATAINKAICCLWEAILTQLNPMNADTALTEAVSENDHFRNVNTTYANSGNVS